MVYVAERTRTLIEQRDRQRRLLLGVHDRWLERLTIERDVAPPFPAEAERHLRQLADDALDDATVEHFERRIAFRQTRDLRRYLNHALGGLWSDGADLLFDALGNIDETDWHSQPPDAARVKRFIFAAVLADALADDGYTDPRLLAGD